MKELEKLLKENSGLLSRMKERDGNEKLNKICEEIFKKDLTNSHKQSIIQIQRKKERKTEMTKIINLDCDGTFINLYGVNGWLDDLINEDVRPYREAKPLVNLVWFARTIHELQNKGWKVNIISWTSKNGTKEYNARVKQTKLEWFETHIPSVKFDNVYIVDYGTPKTSLAKGILFDDEEHNRNEWNGIAFDEKDLIKKMRAFL